VSDFDRIRPPRTRSSRSDGDGPMALFSSVEELVAPRRGYCTIRCATCRTTQTVSLAGLVRVLWPATVIVPWKWHPVFGRCLACHRRTWLRVRCSVLREGG